MDFDIDIQTLNKIQDSEKIQNRMIERIIRRQEKTNEIILREIGKTLGDIGELTPSQLYTIEQQLKYGESLDKILKLLSETSNINEAEIYKMLEADARINLNNAKKYYIARGIDFVPYEENIPLQNLVKQIAYTTLKTYRNIANTTGLTFINRNGKRVTKVLKNAYYDIVDDAINSVATGKETFYQTLERQLKTIGKSGIQSIEYESGYHRRIDSALRMNMQDGLSQLAIAQQELMGEQFGANMIEVTHHQNSAPDHIDSVDGRQFVKLDVIKQQIENGIEKEIKLEDIKENGLYYKNKWYYDFDYINENLKRKVGTLNCRHRTFTGILGIDEPRYTEEELERDKKKNEEGFEFEGNHFSLYKGEQLLRKIELELRKARETKIMAKASNTEEGKQLFDKMKARETMLLNKYHELSKISGLPTKLERTRVLTK